MILILHFIHFIMKNGINIFGCDGNNCIDLIVSSIKNLRRCHRYRKHSIKIVIFDVVNVWLLSQTHHFNSKMSHKNMTPKHSSRNLPNPIDKLKMEARERKRNILHLILGYLREHMLENTAECLLKEAQLENHYQVCENVELDVILQEYQSYYFTKFQKYPKIVRKLDELEQRNINKSAKRAKSAKRSTPAPISSSEKTDSPPESDIDFQFEIISLNGTTTSKEPPHPDRSKPKPFFPELELYASDNKDMINQISSQVVIKKNEVKWSDCLGLHDAIEVLKESSIYPLQYPEIFKDLVSWKGILLHGPPGTGKTMLAKALASEGNTTFFNVTSSTFISKWRGESEKMIKFLFELAKLHAPSTIFFDEIDALVSGAKDTQHEASKRFKSELLIQLDGILSTEGQICVLASTNSPWDLDNALLRRFDKRILIDMPDKDARIEILKHSLRNSKVNITPEEYEEFGTLTKHYSGSDIKSLSKEISMSVVREVIQQLERGKQNQISRLITFVDIKTALQKTRPSTSSLNCKKYYQWQNEHGAF